MKNIKMHFVKSYNADFFTYLYCRDMEDCCHIGNIDNIRMDKYINEYSAPEYIECLCSVAVKYRHFNIFEKLIEYGNDLCIIAGIQEASAQGDYELFEKILYFYDINDLTHILSHMIYNNCAPWQTPLYFAGLGGNLNIVKKLIELGNNEYVQCLNGAFNTGRQDIIEYIINEYHPMPRPSHLRGYMIYSVLNKNPDLVRLAINMGANPVLDYGVDPFETIELIKDEYINERMKHTDLKFISMKTLKYIYDNNIPCNSHTDYINCAYNGSLEVAKRLIEINTERGSPPNKYEYNAILIGSNLSHLIEMMKLVPPDVIDFGLILSRGITKRNLEIVIYSSQYVADLKDYILMAYSWAGADIIEFMTSLEQPFNYNMALRRFSQNMCNEIPPKKKYEIIEHLVELGANNFNEAYQEACLTNNSFVVSLMVKKYGITDFNAGLLIAFRAERIGTTDLLIKLGANNLQEAYDRIGYDGIFRKYFKEKYLNTPSQILQGEILERTFANTSRRNT